MKNRFTRTTLAAAVAAAVAGCGGSSSSLTGGGASYEATGAVADGYLVGATVCLDLNENNVCDTGEPFATSGENGAFTLTTSTQTDLDAPIVVEVGAETIDEDTGAAVGAAYTLTAPAGSSFVSPITTLVNHFATQNPTFTADEVEAIVHARLGAGAGLDIMADYVANGDDAEAGADNKEAFERLHIMARVIADGFGDNLTVIDASSAASGATFNAKFGVMVDHVLNQLESLVEVIDEMIESEVISIADVSAALESTGELLAVDTEALADALLQASLEVTAADFSTILTTSASLYDVEAETDEQIEGPALFREVFGLNGSGNATFVEQAYNAASGTWEVESTTDTSLFLDASGNWLEGDWSVSSSFTVNADGSATIEYSFGSFDYTAAALGLSGKSIADFVGDAYDSAPTFSSDAAAIRLAETPAADIFEISIWDEGDTSMCPDANCNLVFDAMGSPITSLANLKSTGLLGGVVVFGDAEGTSGSLDMSEQALVGVLQVMLTQAGMTEQQISAALAGIGAIITFDENGMLNLGSWRTESHASGADVIILETPMESPVDLSMAAAALQGVDLSMLTGGFSMLFDHDMDEFPMFAEVAGGQMTVVRSGYFFKEGRTAQLNELWFNEQAMSDIVEFRLGVPEGDGSGDSSACSLPAGSGATEAEFDAIAAACGLGFPNESALVGTFEMTIAGISATTTLNADGTGEASALGQSFPITWEVNGSGVAVMAIDMGDFGGGTVKMAPLDATGTVLLYVSTPLAPPSLAETTL